MVKVTSSVRFQDIPWPPGLKLMADRRYFFGTMKKGCAVLPGNTEVASAEYNGLTFKIIDIGSRVDNPQYDVPGCSTLLPRAKVVVDTPIEPKKRRGRKPGVPKAVPVKAPKAPKITKTGKKRKPRATKAQMIARRAKEAKKRPKLSGMLKKKKKR